MHFHEWNQLKSKKNIKSPNGERCFFDGRTIQTDIDDNYYFVKLYDESGADQMKQLHLDKLNRKPKQTIHIYQQSKKNTDVFTTIAAAAR